MKLFEFFRKDRWPHMFCPGCGIGIVMNCFYRAFSELSIDIDKCVFVSGIGCSSRIPGYIYGDSLHTTHGRPLAFATGIKLGNPELKVIVFTGDGDLGAIGGNHFINACRRNIDLTVVCINNNIYGMTGGQASTTTPHGFLSTTTPFGNIEYPFDLSRLASTAGANYAARWTVSNPKQLIRSFKVALQKRGLSFVEVMSPCPAFFGRLNRMARPVDHYRWLKDNSMPLEKTMMERDADYDLLDLHLGREVAVGVLRDAERKSYLEIIGLEKR